MAYKSNDKQEVFAQVEKNGRGEYIQISKIIHENGKAPSLDVRQMYTDTNDEIRPTTKGVRFNSEIAGDVVLAMFKALETEAVLEIADEILLTLSMHTGMKYIETDMDDDEYLDEEEYLEEEEEEEEEE